MMIARLWRGWTAADAAEEVVARLRAGALARFVATPGNISAELLLRPHAGGVEVLTLTVWASRDAVPEHVEEQDELFVARQTIPDFWELPPAPSALAHAA